MQWQLHPDGSFDLIGGPVNLRGCYPALDGAAVRPLHVAVATNPTGGTVRYSLADQGVLDLFFGSEADGGLTLHTTYSGATAPHWLLPLAGARVEGANRLFRQSCGMGGATEFVPLPLKERVDSYTLVALLAPGESTLSISARDYRRFSLRAAMYPEQGETQSGSFEIGFATDRIPLNNQVLAMPPLYFSAGSDPLSVMEAAAQAIGQAMQARTQQPTYWHWCSWYYLFQHLSEQLLDE